MEKNNNMIMNGDLYIKIKPTDISSVVNLLSDAGNRALDAIDRLESEEGITTGTEGLRMIIEHSMQLFEKSDLYYGDCEDFNLLLTDGKNHMMTTVKSYINLEDEITSEELKDEYIRLIDFLSSANYVGKRFRSFEDVDSKDSYNSNKSNNDSCIVLYATKEAMLILNLNSENNQFGMLDPRYFQNGEYEFYGETIDDYRDRRKLYKDIFNQVYSRYKKNRQKELGKGNNYDDNYSDGKVSKKI